MRILITLFLATLIPQSVFAESESNIIKNVETEFANMTTMSAKFKQTFFDAAMEESETTTGTMKIKKQLKMQWIYDPPEQQIIISDGKNIYLYMPDEKQVIVEKIGNIINSSSPALFLAGGRALRDIFTIRLATDENKDRMGAGIRLELIPKQESISVTRIIVAVDAKNWRIRSFSIIDWAGNRTDVELFDIQVNKSLDDGLFTFKAPKGVEAVKLPNMKME